MFDMVCNGSCPDGGTSCAKNIYLGDHCRQNNDPNAPIDPTKCAPLLPTSLYRVAVNDFIAAGGSGFDVLKRNSSKQDTGVSLRDGLRVYLNQQAKCASSVVDETDTNNPQRSVISRYGQISCLDEKAEPHDGRIRPVFE
jgi:hypothetical protein